jgi:hypothetical protein
MAAHDACRTRHSFVRILSRRSFIMASKCLSIVDEESLTSAFQISFIERCTLGFGSNLQNVSVS